MARIAAVADLFFGSKIDATLRAAGHEVTMVSGIGDLPNGVELVIVDLDTAGDEAPSAPSLGYYSHVDAETRTRAERAGFDLVVPRSRMAREMPALVERVLASRSS